ncbi:MAG: hypothetical protein WAO52_16890 [Prolixibacteraceae bacterium]
MIQNIIALIIVGGVAVKTIYSVYKSITTKNTSVCGGCASCELKNELKKKGKLLPYSGKNDSSKIKYSAETLKFSGKG